MRPAYDGEFWARTFWVCLALLATLPPSSLVTGLAVLALGVGGRALLRRWRLRPAGC